MPSIRTDGRRRMAEMGKGTRRGFLGVAAAGAGTLLLNGCRGLSQTEWFPKVLDSAEGLTMRVQRLFAGSWSLAPEYKKADLSPTFKANGTLDPGTPAYTAMAANGFRDWRIPVSGLVAHPFMLSLDDLRAMPSRTQITRHDCVEGWSCIGKWKGALLGDVVRQAGPQSAARYVVFRCADPMDNGDPNSKYYESISLEEAFHPQTILAYEMNDAVLPVAHGAP